MIYGGWNICLSCINGCCIGDDDVFWHIINLSHKAGSVRESGVRWGMI